MVGGFLVRTAVKVVTHCAVFFLYFLKIGSAVHSLLGVVKYSIEFTLQLTYNLGTLQFSWVWNSAILSQSHSYLSASRIFVVFSPPPEMWALMLPECCSCFTIVSSEWERMIWGVGSGRDLLGGGENLCK